MPTSSLPPLLPPLPSPLQIEKYEYEIEELSATGGKKKSKPPPRIEFLQGVIAVHKKHCAKLEAALRCLDNDALEAEDLDPIRDSLEYYLVRRGRQEGEGGAWGCLGRGELGGKAGAGGQRGCLRWKAGRNWRGGGVLGGRAGRDVALPRRPCQVLEHGVLL